MYEKLFQETLEKQARIKYAAMLQLSPSGKRKLTIFDDTLELEEMRNISSHIATVINVLFSGVAMFCFVNVFFIGIIPDTGLRCLVGLLGSMALIGVECALIVINMAREEKQRDFEMKENKKPSLATPITKLKSE